MPPASSAPSAALLSAQILGDVLLVLVFLFLWRESGIRYFRSWSLPWAIQAAALLAACRYFFTGGAFWLVPYALLDFAFALSLLGAATLEPGWRQNFRVLLGLSLFLALVYSPRLHTRFDAFRALHAAVLAAIYFYSYLMMRGNTGVGRRIFCFALLGLTMADLHHAIVLSYLNLIHASPNWASYLHYINAYDFVLQMLLAFSALAMWIDDEASANFEVDRLTGLLNHAALSRRMDAQDNFNGVVSVCDMDNFKEVNDRYGHLIGDEVLRNVGHLVRSSIRQEDEAFRWGGDEFVILFRNQNLAVVEQRMRGLEQRLRNFHVRGHGLVPITFSWGAVEVKGSRLRQSVDEADREMYVFKRNR